MGLLDKKINDLKGIIQDLDRSALAYSGGVDSSLLMFFCNQILGDRFIAITVRSPLQKESEIQGAKRFAEKFKVRHEVIDLNPLDLPGVVKNDKNRCYICKRYMMSEILKYKNILGFDTLMDGTNYSDKDSLRPGLKALSELGVASPLMQAGITKDEILGLLKTGILGDTSIYSESCLATRLPYGKNLDIDLLKKIEVAEIKIQQIGFDSIRLRCHGKIARLEIPKRYFDQLDNKKIEKIVKIVKDVGFSYVTLDLEGFRSGSMDL